MTKAAPILIRLVSHQYDVLHDIDHRDNKMHVYATYRGKVLREIKTYNDRRYSEFF